MALTEGELLYGVASGEVRHLVDSFFLPPPTRRADRRSCSVHTC